MEVRHLRYLVALVQESSFSAAAKKLHIAQPALSQNIRQLEEELGVRLFERSTRQVTVTNAGKSLYRDALALLTQFESAGRTAQRTARGETGSLSIGFTTTAMLGGELPKLLRAFRHHYPDVQLTLQDFAVDVLVEKLQSTAIDIACTEEIWPDDSLEFRALKPLPMVMAMYKDHHLALRAHLQLKMFADEPFLLPTPYRVWTLHDSVVRACQQAGFQPNCKGYADNVPVAVGLVASQFGVALMHGLPMFRCPDVIFRQLDDAHQMLPIHLIWRKGALSPTANNFLSLLRPHRAAATPNLAP